MRKKTLDFSGGYSQYCFWHKVLGNNLCGVAFRGSYSLLGFEFNTVEVYFEPRERWDEGEPYVIANLLALRVKLLGRVLEFWVRVSGLIKRYPNFIPPG